MDAPFHRGLSPNLRSLTPASYEVRTSAPSAQFAIVEPELIEGDPADALLRVAQSRRATEIVVGSRGRGRFRSILGSVSHELLERADRPVVIVPKGAVDVDH